MRPFSATPLPSLRCITVSLLTGLFLFALLMLGWRLVVNWNSSAERDALAEMAEQTARSLMRQTALYQNALIGLRAGYLAAGELDPAQFARYVDGLQLDHNLQGLRAMAFNREVEGERLDAYLAAQRQRLADLHPIYRHFNVSPAGPRQRYHLVELIHPHHGNINAVGFDIWSSPVRREAIERARQDGFAVSAPILLRQDSRTIAVLMIAPVPIPSAGQPLATVAASFRLDDLVDVAISPAVRRTFHLRLRDLGTGRDGDNQAHLLFIDGPEDLFDAWPHFTTRMQFGGRHWELSLAARHPDNLGSHFLPWLAITVLALLAAALGQLAFHRHQRSVRHHALARMASDSVLSLDGRGIVRETDEAISRITGQSAPAWQGQPLAATVLPADAQRLNDALAHALAHPAEAVSVEFRMADPIQGERWLEARMGNYLAHPDIGRILVHITDIDGRKQAESVIARMAFIDSLTGLANRRLLEERAQLTLGNSRRRGAGAAVLLLDLDGFKTINDTAGHAAGDEVLIEVARRLQACIRESDTVARLGGDEFVVLLSEPAGEEEVRIAAQRILETLGRPVQAGGRVWQTGASIGAALYPEHGKDFATLLTAADAAMYRSKREGPGGLSFGRGKS